MAFRARRVVVTLAAGSLAGLGFASACGLSDEGTGSQSFFVPETGTPDNYYPPPPPFDAGAPVDSGKSTLDAEAGADGACPIGRGPDMVRVDGQCVDLTEVTTSQYEKFLDSLGDASIQDGSVPPMCKYKAGPAVAAYGRNFDGGELSPYAPSSYTDYCDAVAFCAWAGKRLCRDDAGAGTWYDVCSQGGAHAYAYGDDPMTGVCNDTASPSDAGGFPACRVGDAGPFDMNGNMMEWVGPGCYDAGPNFFCDLRGGSFLDDASTSSCAHVDVMRADMRSSSIGFRCCAD